MADSYENKGFADILKMNLQLTQEVLMYRIFNDKSNMHCCSDGHLTLNGSFDRRIRTSLGEFKMVFWRIRCSKCGKAFASLAKFIMEVNKWRNRKSLLYTLIRDRNGSAKSWFLQGNACRGNSSKLQSLIAGVCRTFTGMQS